MDRVADNQSTYSFSFPAPNVAMLIANDGENMPMVNSDQPATPVLNENPTPTVEEPSSDNELDDEV